MAAVKSFPKGKCHGWRSGKWFRSKQFGHRGREGNRQCRIRYFLFNPAAVNHRLEFKLQYIMLYMNKGGFGIGLGIGGAIQTPLGNLAFGQGNGIAIG